MEFPGYDLFMVHFYAHSPDYNTIDCDFCIAVQWDMSPVPDPSPFDVINGLYPST
jgi:hypothetical protein